jgi:tetratricopeptide (TPR) repeat protein
MTKVTPKRGHLAAALIACLAGWSAQASDLPPPEPAPTPPAGAELAQARKAIQAKDWPQAVRLLEKVTRRDGASADAFNLLGFAERNQGHLEAAFAHYEKALRLDPKHRGAHEYVGEAYLMAGNPDKAREHLAALAKLCSSTCEEYLDLEKDIAEYDRKHGAPR